MKALNIFRNFLKFYLFIFLLVITSYCYSQTKTTDTDFHKKADSIILLKVSQLTVLDSALYSFKNDTIKMAYLAEKSSENNFHEGQSYALNALGTSYRNISHYYQALDVHKRALKSARISNNLELEVLSLNMLGVVYRRMDAIRSALDYHKQALDLAESASSLSLELKRSIAVSQNSMGNIYLALKQYDLALEQFNKSLKIEEVLNNPLGLAINNHNIGYAKEKTNNLEEALNYYQKSLTYNNEIDSEIGRVICYNSIGKIYILQEKYETASEIINNALSKSLEINDQYYIATSHLNLGLVQLKQNLLPQAEKNLNKALVISENFNLKSSKIEAYNYLSELHEKKGNYNKALSFYKRHVNLDGTLTNERNIQYVNDLIIKYESEKKNNQIKELASENEIVKLKLTQNKRTLLLGSLGVILVLIILYILYRQRQLNNEKKIITLEQEMLRNQMNPHFIFNSLNSIKLYIINNEKENAVYYLNKFSKLIRKILIASIEKEISLQDELDTMNLYMNIENIRFSNAISYNVKIDESLNPSLIKVPSLILQPFLENAIWHGLSSKTANKEITLEAVKNRNSHVTISITDNGIGRKASGALKKERTLKRQSVGIDITKARLENFSKSFNEDYSLKIIDLYDKDQAIGTQVILEIPIKSSILKIA